MCSSAPAICCGVAFGPRCSSVIVHRVSPGLTTTRAGAAPAPRFASCAVWLAPLLWAWATAGSTASNTTTSAAPTSTSMPLLSIRLKFLSPLLEESLPTCLAQGRGQDSKTFEARQKGAPLVRGYLSGAVYGKRNGRGRAVRCAAKPRESAPLQKRNREHHKDGKQRQEDVGGRPR